MSYFILFIYYPGSCKSSLCLVVPAISLLYSDELNDNEMVKKFRFDTSRRLSQQAWHFARYIVIISSKILRH